MRRGRRVWIREQAQLALKLAGATRPDQIDPIRTAQALEIEIAYGGVVGATERISMIGDRARIRITDAIVLPGRRSFTIGHGIGHKVCRHAIPVERDVEQWIGHACGRRGSIEEREADVFATEHLTPEPWTRPYCTGSRRRSRCSSPDRSYVSCLAGDGGDAICGADASRMRSCLRRTSAREVVQGSRSFPGRIERRSEGAARFPRTAILRSGRYFGHCVPLGRACLASR